MWIPKAAFRVLRADADRGRTLTALLAAEQEAHRLSRVALMKAEERVKALDERLVRMQAHVLRIEEDLRAARKGSWRWTDNEGTTHDASA